MTDKSTEALIRSQERLRRQLDPMLALFEKTRNDPALQIILKEKKQWEAMLKAVRGPLYDFQQACEPHPLFRIDSELKQLIDASKGFENTFRALRVNETEDLLRQHAAGKIAGAQSLGKYDLAEIHTAMGAMRHPWIDIGNELRSVDGFVRLHSIGRMLQTMSPFGTSVTNGLRLELGDWRGNITWPDEIFTDALARTQFYLDRGLNPVLAAFPANAFDDALTIAGLREIRPRPIPDYDSETEFEPTEDEFEAGLERNNDAHDRLQRFEFQVRNFIHREMRSEFGPNWEKIQVHGARLKDWHDNHQKAMNAGEREYPLVYYADFTDYVVIIVQKDNWNRVFKKFFSRKAFVEESFQRLFPVRICVMHARLITQDDELYLLAETKRILNAINSDEDF